MKPYRETRGGRVVWVVNLPKYETNVAAYSKRGAERSAAAMVAYYESLPHYALQWQLLGNRLGNALRPGLQRLGKIAQEMIDAKKEANQ